MGGERLWIVLSKVLTIVGHLFGKGKQMLVSSNFDDNLFLLKKITLLFNLKMVSGKNWDKLHPSICVT